METQRGFITSKRGVKLCTQQWTMPDPKALIVMLHGYGGSGSWFEGEALRFTKMGYSCYTFDQQGHGDSDGIPGYVEDFDILTDDTAHYIETILSTNKKHQNCFLYGASMGGGIAVLISLKYPNLVAGLILLAPMLKVVESFKPHPAVVYVLRFLAYYFPTWAIVPTEDIIDKAYKMQEHRDMARNIPKIYSGRVRLGTGAAILSICDHIEANLGNVNAPLLVLHGLADSVTAYEVSEELFEKSPSPDKTLKLYQGMWHALTYEPNSKIIYETIDGWIEKRSSGMSFSLQDKEIIAESPTPNTHNGADQILLHTNERFLN